MSETTSERCPECRHAPHGTLGFCPNMASDNDCACTHAGDAETVVTGSGVPTGAEGRGEGLAACEVCGARADQPCTYTESWPRDGIRAGDPAEWVHRFGERTPAPVAATALTDEAVLLAEALHEMACEDNPGHADWSECATTGPCRDEGERLATILAARVPVVGAARSVQSGEGRA